MSRIPLLVLGGFLGAGKTTLLNRLLSEDSGRRLAVLVNDFGPINVDAELVAAHDGDTLSLTNGCICCSIGSGLEDALIRVLDRDPPPDLIVIEASGVSDPGRIAQVGLSDPMLQLEAVLVMVDGERILEQLDDVRLGDTLARQIAAASVLVLNKTDLLDTERLATVSEGLRERFGELPLLPARFGELPLARLLDAGDAATLAREHRHDDAHGSPDHPFESGLWRAPGVLDADRLIAALKALPASVIRAKGRVVTDRHGPTLVHLAGGRVRFEKPPATRAHEESNELVYIGLRGEDLETRVSASLDATRQS